MRKFKGITVRQIAEEDIEAVYNLIKNDEDRYLYIGGDFNFGREEFVKFLFSTEYGTTSLPAVIEKDGVIGIAIINNISSFKRSAHFRQLIIAKEYRSKGYGFWTVAIICNYIFMELGFNKLYAGTWSHNPNMDAIYKWFGSKLEGIDRDHAKINGKFVDRKLWGLLKREVPVRLDKIFTRIKNENRKDIWPYPS